MTKAIVLLAISGLAAAQPGNWTRPYPAHKIAGNVYYVGTEDLACFLVTDPAGHILINTGLAGSVPQIRESVEKMGFKFGDIKILLTMQAHFDHVAGFAEVVKLTGAKVYATEGDAVVIEDGGRSDPGLGPEGHFARVKVARRLKDGETVKLGGTELTVRSTPGHTRGSVSYSTTVNEGGKQLEFLFVNKGTVVMPLVGNAKYPNIVADFEKSFAAQKTWRPDIWVSAHASQYRLVEKHRAGTFVDRAGYPKAIAEYEEQFREQLAKESAKRK